jgi:hypothetical protein
VRNCSGTGNNSNSNPVFWLPGYAYFYGNSFTSFGDDVITSHPGQFNGMVHLHGCTIDNDANTARAQCQSASVIGCRLRGVQLSGLATGAAPDILGRMVHSTRGDANEGTIAGFALAMIGQTGNTRVIGARGESWVNVLLRKTRTAAYTAMSGSAPTLQISADFVAGPVDQPAITNVNMAYISCAGGRFNGLYNEAATTRVLKEVRQIGVASHQMNTKGDLFAAAPAASGARTGTFAYRFGNARFGIVTGDTSANGETTPGPLSWMGDALPPLSQNNVGYGNMWVNDTSYPGANSYASDGDYAPQAVLLNRIPTGRAATGFDLNGAARLNNGTGAAGAVERAGAMLAPASARSGQITGSPGWIMVLPLAAASAQAVQSATTAGLTIALAIAASDAGQPHRATVVTLSGAGNLSPAGAGQGQRAAPAMLVWSAALAANGAAVPHHAQATLVASIAVANGLLPASADQPQRVAAGRLFADTAANAAHTLIPDPAATTFFVS